VPEDDAPADGPEADDDSPDVSEVVDSPLADGDSPADGGGASTTTDESGENEAATATGSGDPSGDGDAESGPSPLRSPSKLLLAALAGLAGFAGSYGVAGRSAGFLLEPFSTLLTTYSPAVLLRYLRNELGSTLQTFTAAGMAVFALAVVAVLALWVADRVDRPLLGAPLAAVASAGVAFVATGVVGPAMGAGAAVGVVLVLGEGGSGWSTLPTVSPARRRVLSGVVAAAGIGLVGRVVGNQRSAATAVDSDPLADQSADDATGGDDGGGGGDGGDGGDAPDPTLSTVDQGEVDELLSTAATNSLSIEGIEPLVSRDFYSVDINKVDPEVDAGSWSLSVTGEVGSERTLDYEEIRAMEYEHRFVTLRCVSDGLNGGAIDNALWTGVPAAKVLEGTDPQGEYVLLHGDDGYSVGFPLEAFRVGFLAYGMNGKVLPRAHGFPLRALVPGHWGETNAKWITEIEVTDELQDGYWEQRGWEGTGPVHTVAKVHAVNRLDGRIEVGGPAYAGTRGVSGVEVSTDGGETWEAAELSEPLPGEDVWRHWRFEYDAPGEKHEVVARAIEADGTVQPSAVQDAYPEGATGYASKTVKP
jgi:hypothetical protein